QYDNLAPGASTSNKKAFALKLLPSFVAGTPIELALDIQSPESGSARLLHRQFTGTPVPTTLLSQDFNGVAPGTLPAGWTVAHGAGPLPAVPWTTSSTFCGSSNAAFHVNDTGTARF